MSKEKSAELLMQLYDLRREETMRKARNWMFEFRPTSGEEIGNTMMDPEVGPYLRMVTSYWDMAASFVNHGAIDADMFNDVTGEHVAVFAKLQPFLAEMREQWDSPDMFKHLEDVITGTEKGQKRLQQMQDWFKQMEEQNAQAEEAGA